MKQTEQVDLTIKAAIRTLGQATDHELSIHIGKYIRTVRRSTTRLCAAGKIKAIGVRKYNFGRNEGTIWATA